jgi:hypothetical protein
VELDFITGEKDRSPGNFSLRAQYKNMNKKIIITGIVFVGLASLVFWLSRQKSIDKATLFPDRDFAVKDTQNVYRIFLADRDGETILLERKEDGWMLNQKYPAFEHTVNMLLSTLAELHVKYIPPRAAVPGLVSDVAANGIKVELYDRKNERMKTFYVGGNTHDDLGTAFIMEGYEQPYIMHLPSLEGGLRSRFRIREQQLISRWIFQQDPDRITRVEMHYPTLRNKSFILEMKGGEADVRPYYPATKPVAGDVLPAAAESFLYGFQKLGAEAILQDKQERDSIMQLIPFCEIKVTDEEGKVSDLQLWPIYDVVVEDAAKFDNPQQEWFVERYYAYSPSKDLFYLIQHHVFGKILWGYENFFDPASIRQEELKK